MNQKSANLDLLRATAVTLVLVSHLLHVMALAHPFLQSSGIADAIPGPLGVWMFFIHTSLVLMMSLERLSSSGPHVATRFYIRRAFRIYPLSIFTVIMVVALRIPPYFGTFVWPGKKIILLNLALVQNFFDYTQVTGPLWSLPYEVQMYLLMPVLFLIARRLRSIRGVTLFVASGFLLYRAEMHLAQLLHYPPALTYAPWFFMGIGCYAISRMVPPFIQAKWFPVCLASLVVLVIAAHKIMAGNHEGWVIWAFGLLFALSLPHFKDITSRRVRSTAQLLANYSYGIYLCHVPILWFAFQRLSGWPVLVRIGVCMALLVVVPVLLFHGLESPMIRMGSKLAGLLEGDSRPAAAHPPPLTEQAANGD